LLAALVGLVTLLGALKPLHMDDTAYHYYAAWIADHPLDPYGFKVFWYEQPQPAHDVLAPPLLPYWWALAIRLFGEEPFWWKCWLLPFHGLLVGSLYQLFRRFARGLEMPLVWMTVLSPTFLPSFNLMLDLPALALSLSALVVFLSACERNSVGRAVLAGLCAGLAAQTKYTGLLAPGVLLLCALRARQRGLWLIAAAVFGLVFVSWEGWTALLYGESHFLHHLRGTVPGATDKAPWLSLAMILGGVASAQLLLNLQALGVRRRFFLLTAGLVALGFLLLLYGGEPHLWRLRWQGLLFRPSSPWTIRLSREIVILGGLGWLFGGTLAAVAWRLGRGRGLLRSCRATDRDTAFLIGWLVLEVVGYFALTPFPAVRRVLGVVVVGTLLAGRLASLTCRSAPTRPGLCGIAALSLVLGVAFYLVDRRDALAQQQVVQLAAEQVPGRERGRIWYTGHWGFQYYAEQAGMKPVVPGRSRLCRGDWLVLPGDRINQQHVQVPEDKVERVQIVTVDDAFPQVSLAGYYGSRAPLEAHPGARVSVTLYRVVADFIPFPQTPPAAPVSTF
jgi:hypothetical protein